MSKKLFLSILITIIMLLVAVLPTSFAVSLNGEEGLIQISKVIDNPNNWKPGEPDNLGNASDLVGNILGAIQGIGTIVSVIALVIIGIKEMTGSIEEKSRWKEALPGYLIGALMVFSITTLPNVLYNVFHK